MAIKRLAILLAAALILSGCGLKSENDTSAGNNSMAQEKESSDSETINAHVPVTIKQGSERIALYELLVSAMTYSKKHGCMYGDGARLSNLLPEVAADLPSARWGDDFCVQIPENLRFYYIDIFNEAYEAIDRQFPGQDESDEGPTASEICMNYLEELPWGTYYVSVAVVKDGEYVEAEGTNEYTIYEYAFRLDKELPPYSYSGDDIYMKGICEYFSALSEEEREWQKKFAVSEGKGSDIVYIPVPVIMKTETKDDKVYVYGRFWDMWYALDEKNLYCLGGGENAGRLEMTKQDGIFKVTGFEKVRDGSYYPEDWKRLCGEDRDLYERFFTKEEREDRREMVRGELILQYAQNNGLDIESYQDFGWDPVLLPEPDFITAESVEGDYRTFLDEKFPLNNIKVMMADLTHDNHDEMIVFERYESDSFTGALHIYHMSDGDEVIEVYKDDVGEVQAGWRWYYLFNDGEGKEQLVQYIPGIFGGSGVFALDIILFLPDGSYTRDNIASVTYDTTHFHENQQEEMKKQLELFKDKLFQYKDASKQLVAVGDDMYLLKEESLYFGGDTEKPIWN